MKKIKITAKLFDGRIAVSEGFLPFDAILYSAYAKTYHPELSQSFLTCLDDAKDFPLPIKRINPDTQDWYYAASFACFDVLSEDTRMYNKRFNEFDVEKYAELRKAKKIVTRKGKYKNCRSALTVILTPEINWYTVGDIEEIYKLLQSIKFLGKKRSQGIGMVKEWVVEETAEDLSHLRPVPDKNSVEESAIRPLYFNPSNIRKVAFPNDKKLGFVQLFGGV